jgi:hypothetical protein
MVRGIHDLAREVRQDWDRQGLSVAAADLTEVPPELRDRLPEAFTTFVAVAGLPEEEDSKLIRFWSPNEWVESTDSSSESANTYLVFADYMIDSHRYAVWLSGEPRGDVSLVFNEPEPPIGAFTDFLRAYLADDRTLYG